jgi:hypothetical protein
MGRISHGAIRFRYKGMRFHSYSFESNSLPEISLQDLRVECERRLAYFEIRFLADNASEVIPER